MNNKGFSLVELIGSLVILSLILLIAIPSITGISNIIKKNQRKNVISEIEINGARYAFETGETLFFVDDLVHYGYMDSDDEDDNIIDPISNESLNCYPVKAEKEGDYYRATFIEDNSYNCDKNKLKDDNTNVKIVAKSGGKTIDEGVESKASTVTLIATLNNASIDCNKYRCLWTSSRGTSIVGESQITINVENLIDARYNFQVTMNNSDGTINNYKKSFHLVVNK